MVTREFRLGRRAFVRGALAAAAGPFIGQARSVGDRPALALIGAGMRGRALLHEFLGQNLVVTRVCDCDRVRREDRARVVNDYYAQHPQLGIPGTVCRAVADFREILADPSVDMVCVATPDHWHAYMAVEAMKAGKDVYCETPLALTVDEAKAVWATAVATGRILQTGSQCRSGVEFRTACEVVRNGGIGKIQFVDVNFGGPSRPHRDYEDPARAASEGAPNPDVDFDMWCGGAPLAKYSDRLAPRGVHDFHPMFWRYDDWFGLGMCGDEGAHRLDIAQWGLGMDGAGPLKVVRSEQAVPSDPILGGRRQAGLSLLFPDGVVVRHNPFGGSAWGTIFHGTEGVVAVDRGRLLVAQGKPTAESGAFSASLNGGVPDGMKKVSCWIDPSAQSTAMRSGNDRSLLDAVGRTVKAFKLKKAPVKLVRSSGQAADFVEACISRRPPCSPAEVGARTAILCALCNLGYVHDRGFAWDSKSNVFADGTGDPGWLTRTYRGPWSVRIGG